MVLCQVPGGGPVCVSLSTNCDCFSEWHTPMGLRNRRCFFRFVGTFPTGGLRALPSPPRVQLKGYDLYIFKGIRRKSAHSEEKVLHGLEHLRCCTS